MKKIAEELFREREKRVNDAIALKKPDRVPILAYFGFFPATYKGITIEESMYDQNKMMEAWTSTITEFAPDMVENPYGSRHLGPLLEALDCKHLKWPRHGLDEDLPFQYVEGEYMKANEYDAFLFDMSDYLVRTYWPRVFGALESFKDLPPLNEMISYHFGALNFSGFDSPEVVRSLEAMVRAGTQARRVRDCARDYAEEMKRQGFPSMYGAMTHVPFDALSDFFRGTTGAMLDMYREPKKLLEAIDQLLPIMIRVGVNGARRTGVPRVFIPLHKGQEGFMSIDQFKTFYWPGFRQLMLSLIEEGLTPCPFVEGDYTSRLEFLADVPAETVCYHFESTDMFKAKEVLGEKACIRGNVSLSLLATGTPEEVTTYCKKLIDVAGQGGGFIMDAATVLDDAKLENVKAMFDFTKDYGVY
ncbi:MAG: hypothetical protein KAJ01_02240 [Candidatus Hydrogenedentes bacterium]|nr:hypothetical protein [Candidatus Hydrogenedentota bacterium]